MNKIRSVSHFFRLLFQALFLILPIITFLGWAGLQADGTSLIVGGQSIDDRFGLGLSPLSENYVAVLNQTNFDHQAFTNSQKLAGFALNLAPLAIELMILYFLIRLFKLYEQGEIFSFNNVRFIRNIGYLLFIGAIVDMLYEALLGVLLSFQHGYGHAVLSITFDDDGFGTLLIASIIILVSWIMAEGCKLREEQQLTI